LENLTENNKKLYEITRRIYDICFSILLLAVTLPFTPLIALIIKISSKGPVFFTQIRTGKDGKTFRAIKFRTMVTNAETNGPQWATKNDSRVTGAGRFLRKTRIDEIPQLINVLTNEMSLIGPRPERPKFVEELEKEIPFYKERLLVKPGLTGWAQVAGPAYGGSKEESLEKLQYDLYYIKNRSMALDISIVLKTVKTILTRRGQ
jgi:exopolysaccharide biosynthesis polyprenyl glycosylphosphotransferase